MEQKEQKAPYIAIFSQIPGGGGRSPTLAPLDENNNNIPFVLLSRSFRPDMVLVRQHVKDASHDWKNIILGLQYGGTPSINSLHSIFNFMDKPWVVSHYNVYVYVCVCVYMYMYVIYM